MSAVRGPVSSHRHFSGWVLTVCLMAGVALLYIGLVVFVGIELYSATALPMPASNR